MTDRSLNIATAYKRTATTRKNNKVFRSDLIDKLKTPTRTPETIEEYKLMSRAEQGQVKDVGGFVGGFLKNGRRKKENVMSRSMITLDLDHINANGENVDSVWDSITMLYPYELIIYSTHSHTPDYARIRLVIPLSKDIEPDKYEAIGRMIASDIGINMFDDTTYEASRLMYYPSVSSNGEYVFKHQEGDFLDPESVLSIYPDWTDISFYPTSERESIKIEHLRQKQEDPLKKAGLIGAFCRAYTITDAINTFLSDIYEPTDHPDRYTFKGGSTVGGLVIYDDIFAYSHHGTDPSSGELCNAFDLVRIHKFNALDEDVRPNTKITSYPSYKAMNDLAQEDSNVKLQLFEERASSLDDFDYTTNEDDTQRVDEEPVNLDRINSLEIDKQGKVINTIKNILIVLENDSKLKKRLIYDAFANRAQVVAGVPWTDKTSHDWSDMDDSGLRLYLEQAYGIDSSTKIEDAKNLIFDRHKFHPVRDYIKSLTWDGVERVPTIFHDYLGAADDEYTREVAKMHLTASVARVFEPGVKYDTMVILVGSQGLGKSTFINKLSKEWFSDSLTSIKGKEASELIQGVWHVEIGELSAMKKADRELAKQFLSKTHDIYRVAYERNTSRFPRQCVFWGTTNEMSFLRDSTGERRNLPIDCEDSKPKYGVMKDLTAEVINQIRAEAYHLYKNNQRLYLLDDIYEMAIERQEIHKEDDPFRGQIEAYLDNAYPSNRKDLGTMERQAFIRGDHGLFKEYDLTYYKDKVCAMEIRVELFGKRPGDLSNYDTLRINTALANIKGWEQSSVMRFGSVYGRQRGYKRIGSDVD